MEHLFSTYEIALKLKDLGFDEECFGKYSPVRGEFIIITHDRKPFGDQIKAPTWQQAISFIMGLLEAKYNLLYLELHTDLSGAWIHSADDLTGMDKINIEFQGYEELVLTGIQLLNR